MCNNTKKQFREAIPFLKLIPDKIYMKLDTRDFFMPYGEIVQMRNHIEEQLGHFVMTYTAKIWHITHPQNHLCAYLLGAELTDSQKQRLFAIERSVKSLGVSFSVYQKPLVIHDIRESVVYKWYEQNRQV